MSEKLKPCPFCGGEAVVECHDEDYGDDWIVSCINLDGECEITPHTKFYETKQEAIEAWNRRSNQDAVLINEIPSDFRCESCGGKISLVFGSYRMDGWEVEYYKCPDCDVPYLKIVNNQETD